MNESVTPVWALTLIAALTSVTDAVSHKWRLKSERYFVWQEDGANDLPANGAHAEKARIIYVHLFTKFEFDPWIEEVQSAFSDAQIAWSLNSEQYEEDTGFSHLEWIVEV